MFNSWKKKQDDNVLLVAFAKGDRGAVATYGTTYAENIFACLLSIGEHCGC